jgi:hypothetical protein
MATLNNKTVSKVVVSPVQKDGATKDNQALIILFEDGTQTSLNGGTETLANQLKGTQRQFDELQARIAEIVGLQDFIAKNVK